MTTCLITGGCGFLGSHLVDYLLRNTDWKVVVWDSLTYAAEGGWRLQEIEAPFNPRFSFENIDIANAAYLFQRSDFSYIVHLAAETHVDRSIENPWPFITTNVVGTYLMLQCARKQEHLKKFLFFSSDEVFGPADGESFFEWSRYNSSNPYSATKAAGEELTLAWANTYKLPAIVSHCANIFGERQHEEKYIPKLVKAILADETVTIHADEKGHSGSRMYVYAGDVARAIHLMLECGKVREKYNIPGVEVSNEEMAHLVADALGKTLKYKKAYPFADRPGWDFRYSILSKHLFELGWKPNVDFKEQLRKVIECASAASSQPT